MVNSKKAGEVNEKFYKNSSYSNNHRSYYNCFVNRHYKIDLEFRSTGMVKSSIDIKALKSR